MWKDRRRPGSAGQKPLQGEDAPTALRAGIECVGLWLLEQKMHREGFEPSSVSTSHLECDPLDRSGICAQWILGRQAAFIQMRRNSNLMILFYWAWPYKRRTSTATTPAATSRSSCSSRASSSRCTPSSPNSPQHLHPINFSAFSLMGWLSLGLDSSSFNEKILLSKPLSSSSWLSP